MATVNGTTGNDTLNGTSGDDTMDGDAGADTIYGGDGNDTMAGGAGYDKMYGGEGDDTMVGADDSYDDMYGGAGNDTVYGGDASVNWMYGGDDDDDLYGGEGDDLIGGDDGNDTARGGGGDDTISGDAGDDTLHGDEGEDTVSGGTGRDKMYGGTQDDTLYGGFGGDEMYGGDGNDIVQGEQDDDTMFGGAGDDTFNLSDGAGNDTISGGSGSDQIHFVSGSDVEVTFTDTGEGTYTQNSGSTSGSFSGVEEIQTEGGDDTIDASADSGGVTIDSGAGDDTVIGGSGDDTVYGGSGNDDVSGGGGSDVLFGGAGADTLTGGAGDDTLTGGTGTDFFVLEDDDSADVVTDFSLNDADNDGKFDDQIDVSALTGGSGPGGSVVGADVVTTDVGGNALLTFPGGETLLLQGVSPAEMSSSSQYYSAGIPCFISGTLIRTPVGDVAVEALRVGDLVCTLDNGPQPLVWIGQKTLDHRALAARPDLCPVHIGVGALGNVRPLRVSPQHGVLIRDGDGGGRERLVRAKHLAELRGGKVRVARGVASVTYVHLLFEAHQTVWSNGIASESFYPGRWGLEALDGPARDEIHALFPALSRQEAGQCYGAPARDIAKRRSLPGHLAGIGETVSH